MAENAGIAGPAAGDEADKLKANRAPRRRLYLGAAVVLAAAAIGLVLWWLEAGGSETTDDAFVNAYIAQIAPRVAGTVVRIDFADNAKVRAGQLLVELDPRDFEARLASARAAYDAAVAQAGSARAGLELTRVTAAAAVDLAESGLSLAERDVDQARAQAAAAEAEKNRADADVPRYRQLAKQRNVSAQQLEQVEAAARGADAKYAAAQKGVAVAEAKVGQAKAQLASAKSEPQQVAVKQAQLATVCAQAEQAEAALRQARLDLSYTRITAPHDGQLAKRGVAEGEQVRVGQALVALVYGAPWVTANFKETQLTRMRPGQPVTISVDAFPDLRLKGHVDSFQAGTGARFSLLPPENATGNYVKVVQRVPVKIVFDEPAEKLRRLAPGMSVEPTVVVTAEPHDKGTAAASPSPQGEAAGAAGNESERVPHRGIAACAGVAPASRSAAQ